MTASFAAVNLAPTKSAVFNGLPPGHLGREAVLALPDEIPVSQFDALFPILVRLLRTPIGDGPARFAPPGPGGADRGGKPRVLEHTYTK